MSTSDTEPGGKREGEDAPAAEKLGKSEEEDKAGKAGTTPSWARSGDGDAADTAKGAKGAASDEDKAENKDKTEDKDKDKDKDKAENKTDGAKDIAKSDDDDDAEPRVDRATAVFKALPRPAVDSPTTALKMPRPSEGEKSAKSETPEKGVKAGADEKPGSDAKAKTDEAPAERTSTFVPLRRDDVPSTASKPTSPRTMSLKTASPQPEASPSTPQPPAAATPAAAAETSAIPEAERTRQQPMPPRPPLDLLAELTNKPAPPETPVRTAVRRVKIWTPLALLLLVIFAIAQAVRPLPDPTLAATAETEFTFEGAKPSLPWPDEGQGAMSVAGLGAVDAFGEEKPVPIASVTKSMTAYIIMRDHPMKPGQDGAEIPVDATAEKEGGYNESGNESTLDTIKAGDKLSQKDALSALMIPSANNVARLLARWDAGSQEAFVKKMNSTAKQLGMTNTKYTDPSGLDATTVSTAADQVKLGLELVKLPALMDITKLPSWTDPSGKAWRNWNTLVPYDGALGIKTGTTTKAGGNLLFAAKKDVGGTEEQYLVGAILGQYSGSIIDTVNAESKKVMLATQDILVSRTVVKKGDVVGYVDDGLGGQTPVVATKDLTAAGWPSLKISVKIADGGKTIPHTGSTGDVVGELTVGSGPGEVSAPVALQKDLAEPGFGAKLTRVG
ncbi:D-alanyl-D-alanine carboxypeptidase [Streptomyces sp. NPDC088116]|uniref:D-alanyl-D-alanine carboxypeptidase n=1 Tax=Streptomyces sp. NPDC088116 TaxID=3365825 RepID=UPI0038246CC9